MTDYSATITETYGASWASSGSFGNGYGPTSYDPISGSLPPNAINASSPVHTPSGALAYNPSAPALPASISDPLSGRELPSAPIGFADSFGEIITTATADGLLAQISKLFKVNRDSLQAFRASPILTRCWSCRTAPP